MIILIFHKFRQSHITSKFHGDPEVEKDGKIEASLGFDQTGLVFAVLFFWLCLGGNSPAILNMRLEA